MSGVTTLSNTVKLPATSAFLTHTAGTAGALKISSDLGYVEVEDIRFIGNSIGVNGAADLIGLTSSDVTLKGDLKINDGTNDKFVVSASSGNTEVSGSLGVALNFKVGTSTARTFQVTAGDGSLAIGSSSVFMVDGTSGDTVTNGKLAVGGSAPAGNTKTLYVTGAVETSTSLTAGTTLTVGTDADIGGNTEMTGTLSVGGTHADTDKELYVNGDIESTATLVVGTDASVGGNTVLSGTLNAGATTLTSTLDVTGNTEMTGTLSVGGTHADTDKELYVNGDIEATATLEVNGGATTLSSTLDVTGNTEMTGTLSVGGTHADTSNGAVRERRHRGHRHPPPRIGGATLTLSSTLDVTGNTEMTGTLSVGGTHADTSKELYVNGDIETTATLEVGGATTLSDTLDVSGVTTLSNTVKLPATSAFLTHTAGTAGALKISSDLGYVEVEDIRFIGNSIGVNGAADLIGLTSSDVTLKGDLKINDGTNDKFVVSASSGNTEVSGSLGVALNFKVGTSTARTFQVTAGDGSLAIGSSSVFMVDGTSGDTVTNGKLAVGGSAPAGNTKTLYVTGAVETSTSLTAGTTLTLERMRTSGETPR